MVLPILRACLIAVLAGMASGASFDLPFDTTVSWDPDSMVKETVSVSPGHVEWSGKDSVWIARLGGHLTFYCSFNGDPTRTVTKFDFELPKYKGVNPLMVQTCDVFGCGTYGNADNEYYWVDGNDTLYMKVIDLRFFQAMPEILKLHFWNDPMNVRKSRALQQSAGMTLACRPNPFNPDTRVIFSGSGLKDNEAALKIYGMDGRLIRVLQGRAQGGRAIFSWDGRDGAGMRRCSGVYVGWIRTRGKTAEIKLFLAK